MPDDTTSLNAVELATELTIAWLSNPNTRASSEEIPAFLTRMHGAVMGLSTPAGLPQDESQPEFTPATTARRSLSSPDHIISMIDGKPYRTLRRHLSSHGLTPEQYRERYKLKVDYPMVAPTYSEARRSMAKRIGLGRKGPVASDESSNAEVPSSGPGRRSRKAKTAEIE